MKIFYAASVVAAIVLLPACSWDGGPVITSDTDHNINVGGDLNDSKTLTIQVKEKLRNNAQTSLARIQVSSPSEDTVQLSGSVDNDAIRHEAERMAYQVSGVRFVVNNLAIR